MDIKDAAVLEAVKVCIKHGYDNAPKFCAFEPTTPMELLKALSVHPEAQLGDQFFIDVGAVKWCLEQLEQEVQPGSIEA